MKKFALLLTSLLLLGLSVAFAQTKSITGVVTSADDGATLPGVSVVVKGTTLGVVTDIDGKYTLDVPNDATTLVYSYVGMQAKEEIINGRTKIDVKLSADVVDVDEVMVVAYGTTKKESFTGSAGTIKSEDLAKRQVSNVTKSLAGQVAGVQITSSNGQPGTSATVRIRGIGSISASNNPLYVVDGVPFDGSISSINPSDIESMNVLKDASASAIYGARGANGVIIITTKKGKSKEARIRVDVKMGSNSRAIPQYDMMDDPAMYYETFYKALYNKRYYAGKSAAESHQFARNALLDADNGGLGYQVYTIPDGEYMIGTNGKLNPNAKLGYSDGTYYYTPDNWYDELFDSGNVRQEYNVSISGKADKLSYYVSGGYLDDTGIVSGSGFKRISGQSSLDFQAKKWLKVGANINYTHYNYKAPGGQTSWGSSGNLFYIADRIAPIYPMYVRNADGNIRVDNNGITVYDFGTTTKQKRAFMGLSNPAITLELDSHDALTDNVRSKWYADVSLTDELKFSAILGANSRNQRESHLYNPFYGAAVSDNGSVYVEHERTVSFNQQYLLKYIKNIGKHTFDILAGYESYEYKHQYIGISNKNLYNPNIGEIDNSIFSPAEVGSYTNTYSTLGFLGRFKYNYDDKYYFNGSYRRDASSRFHPDHRWGNFGSLGGAWLVDKEGFFQSLQASWVDLLKVKASWGVQGNDNLGNYYPYLDQFKVTNADGDFSTTFDYKGNKDITWETSYSFNTGLEFELFNRKLAGGIEYFSRKTVDLLYNQPVPVSWGYASRPINVGELINKGFELELNYTIINRPDFNWSVNLNATHFRNEVLDLHESVRETGIQRSQSIIEIGGSLYDPYMRVYAGPDANTGVATYYKAKDGEFVLDENGNRTITTDWATAGQVNVGSSLADVYGGFGTSLEFKGFDLSASFSYQIGGEVYDASYQELMHSGDNAGLNWHKDILNAWTPENKNSNVPRLNAGDDTYQKVSTRFLKSSDYLSIDNVTLGYTLPSRLTKAYNISSIRVYVVGDNLHLFSARKGLDPRQSLGATSRTSVGSHRYAAMRTLSAGITVNF
ncbi:TonB-dependent receptor [Prolixibacteraceae bacterium JC049]|nr:TonB-dependent receptor [Prolixibacteraceae bacterium JC049]